MHALTSPVTRVTSPVEKALTNQRESGPAQRQQRALHLAFPLLATLALLSAGVTPRAAAAVERGFTAQDLVSLYRVSTPALSADGRRLVYAQRETDLTANKGRTDLWSLDLGRPGALPYRLTRHDANDSDPVVAPDGKSVYFLSTRSGSSQVWRLPLDGGEAQQVTRLPLDIGSFKLAPQGNRLAFSVNLLRACLSEPAPLSCTASRQTATASRQATARTYDALFVRHWDTWADGTRSVLFSVLLAADGMTAGDPVSLSGSLDGDIPSKPNGGNNEYDFSPDGANVALQLRVAGREEAWSTNFDLYLVPATGGPLRNLTADNLAWDGQPVFSPDGKTLAYVAMRRPGFEADRFALKLLDLATGQVREPAADWDRSVASMAWTRTGQALVVNTDDRGQHPLFLIDAGSGARRRLTNEGSTTQFVVGRDAVITGLQSLGSPADWYRVPLAATRTPDANTTPAAQRLTQVNATRLAGVRLGTAEQFSFAGANGETVYGYVMQPWNAVPGHRYPVAFIVHGGPQSSFANNWSYRWNPQIYAGAGYAAVFIDFHGSPGYGQAFTDSISTDWGGKPFQDLQLGLAAATAKFPWLDSTRACALGASYGGFMMNWIAGNWPDQFKCIVNHAGIFDNRSMYYTTEELWFTEWDHGGPYYANAAKHEEFNPANFVAAWKTPMLVIHGEKDFRVPYAQGLATFTALQRRHIESRLVVFPDENHWILKPANSLLWHDEVLGWLAKHL
jgi:dipeptidyl aminopeptidase/acylaminoacyl peptidase